MNAYVGTSSAIYKDVRLLVSQVVSGTRDSIELIAQHMKRLLAVWHELSQWRNRKRLVSGNLSTASTIQGLLDHIHIPLNQALQQSCCVRGERGERRGDINARHCRNRPPPSSNQTTVNSLQVVFNGQVVCPSWTASRDDPGVEHATLSGVFGGALRTWPFFTAATEWRLPYQSRIYCLHLHRRTSLALRLYTSRYSARGCNAVFQSPLLMIGGSRRTGSSVRAAPTKTSRKRSSKYPSEVALSFPMAASFAVPCTLSSPPAGALFIPFKKVFLVASIGLGGDGLVLENIV